MLPMVGEIAVSHRRKSRQVHRRDEPQDLLAVIAANERVLRLASWVRDNVRESVQWSLLCASFFCWLQVASPWTNAWIDKLPFLGAALLYTSIYVALVKYWGCYGRAL